MVIHEYIIHVAAAVDHYNKDERTELKQKLDMMDENEDTRDGEEGSA